MIFKRNTVRAHALLLLSAMLTPDGVNAQALGGLLGGKSTAPASSSTPSDPLNRTTPRDAIYAFLQACHENRYSLAAQYLDLKKLRPDQRTSEGPELARQLGELLDRNARFEVSRLSNSSIGNVSEGLAPDLELLGTFPTKTGDQGLYLRREALQGMQVWLVSAESVVFIPELAALASESPIESKLPEPLVAIKFVGTPLWIWIALVLLAVILSLLSKALSRLVIAIVKGLSRRYTKSLHTFRLEALMEPLRLLIVVMVFRACMLAIAPSALLRDYLLKMLTLLFFIGAGALAMRIVDIISDQVISRLNPREMALSYSILPLVVRFIKICLFCFATLAVLSFWGYNTNAILAGVGVGGLAVALAAQKTIENLFGGISVITDRPVLVGDFCQFGGQTGTVEDIGLRSTKIRTLDRTLVTVPNSQFSTMTLENYARRDRMWFHPIVQLDKETTTEKIRGMMDALTEILRNHPKISIGGAPLRFTKIQKESFDLEIFAYVLTEDSDEFLKIQTELLLQFIEAGQKLDVGFAVPLQESMVRTHPKEAKTTAAPESDGNRELVRTEDVAIGTEFGR